MRQPARPNTFNFGVPPLSREQLLGDADDIEPASRRSK
jgi:hypothetical protein